MSEVRLDGIRKVPASGSHFQTDSIWKQTANKIVAFIRSLKASLDAWLHPKPVSAKKHMSAEEPTVDKEPLISRVSATPPSADIVQDVAPAVLAPAAPQSIAEETPAVLTDIVMNVVDMAIADLADEQDPLKTAIFGWIKTAAKDKTTEMGQALGKIFADMDYAFLFDQIIMTVNGRLENVIAQEKQRAQLEEAVTYHTGVLTSWFSSQADIDESLEFFAQNFNQTPDAVNEESIREAITRSQPAQAPMDFKPVVKELIEMLNLKKPLSEVSPDEKAARKAFLAAIAEKIPGAEAKDLEGIINLDAANSLIEKALEEQLNTVFKGIFAKLGGHQFLNNLFGKTIFPNITEMLKGQMHSGPQLPVEPQVPMQEQHIPEAYKTLASHVCGLASINPADMLFNNMLAGIIANGIYKYRHSPLLMKQVLEHLKTVYADTASFKKEMTSTEGTDYLLARAMDLPNFNELKAKFEFDLGRAQKQALARLKSAAAYIESSDLEALALKQAEREKEKAFINHVIQTVVQPSIENEASVEASQAVSAMMEAAVGLVQTKIEATSSLAGRLFSYIQAPVQKKLTTKVEGIYRDIFRSQETNTALVSNIARAMITTMHAAKNPSEDIGQAVVMI